MAQRPRSSRPPSCAFAAAALVVALSGCAKIPPMRRAFTPATTGKLARLKVSTDGAVWIVPSRQCPRFDDPRSGLGPVSEFGSTTYYNHEMNGRSLGVPGPVLTGRGTARTEVAVPAEELLLLHYDLYVETISSARWCKLDFLFTPREGYDYAAVAESSPGLTRCRVAVFAVGDAIGAFPASLPIRNEYNSAACEENDAPAAPDARAASR